MRQLQFNLFYFSRFRSELMGVATILIILCHTTKYNLVMPSWLYTILGNCGAGVDIFLFLSGMGIFNSYANREKNKTSVYKWFWRRYIRIIIPCAFFIVPLSIIEYNLSSSENIDINGILLNLSGFGFLFEKGALWFVTCILFLYMITPLIHILLTSKYKYLYASFLCIVALFCGYVHLTDSSILYKLQFMLCRFPSYFIGYVLAKDINNKHKVSIWKLIIVPLFVYIIFFILNRSIGTHLSLFWLQGIFLTSVISLMLKFAIVPKFLSLLRRLGSISLESYATNIMLIPLFRFWNFEFLGIDLNMGRWSFYVIGTLLCIVISYIVNKLSKYLIAQIS